MIRIIIRNIFILDIILTSFCRHLWDEDLMKWRVVEKLDNNSEVFQYITNTMAPHPTRDFVELRYIYFFLIFCNMFPFVNDKVEIFSIPNLHFAEVLVIVQLNFFQILENRFTERCVRTSSHVSRTCGRSSDWRSARCDSGIKIPDRTLWFWQIQTYSHLSYWSEVSQRSTRSEFLWYFTHIVEFFLNDFHWIQRIQWIKTKSKSSMVTRDTPYPRRDTFLDVVVNKDISITISGMVSIHSGESQWISNQL